MYYIAFTLYLLFSIVCAIDIEHYWNIEHVDYNMEGIFTRKAIGINGKWPIPFVEATMGDTLIIHATNKLSEPTSLHSHGLFQNGTNHYDGAAMVTECGIPPNGTFTYRIPLQQAGTYWIHSHSKSQTADGLRTSLIIKDPNEAYHYDDEFVLPMEDWFREPAEVLIKRLNSPDPHIRFGPFVPYGIIGGECANRKRIKFVPRKTYRLRLLNIGASFEFHFSMDGHELRIIEVDGVMVKEKPTHGITLGIGQRASVLVTALNSTAYNYKFHADMFTDLLQMPRYNPLNFTGTVEYSAEARMKRQRGAIWMSAHDLDLEPLDGELALEPNRFISLDAYSGVFNDQTFRHSFNNVTYVAPQVPTLLSALTTGEMAKLPATYGRQTNSHVLGHMEVVQVLVRNHDYYSHPFHLHGHVFQVIEMGSIRTDERSMKEALDTPVKRDTVIVRGGQYAVLRFRADNPGVWLFHCHIDFHIMLGLQMTFIEAPEMIQKTLGGRSPDMYKENCTAQGIRANGDSTGGLGGEASEAELRPSPYPDQFESYDPPNGWQLISYILGGSKDDVGTLTSAHA
ncbi:Cupredoxin [Kickxella alabastrina]|uniref:Cupredoxin n=1 Tax=Kickxella alabastrina TaxID=61397 RepID=UPI00221E654A|nr:Cupredoxin [Kickxella alabastrina]KAI7821642.1 Cupredoxin [Kickxella alabastrina]